MNHNFDQHTEPRLSEFRETNPVGSIVNINDQFNPGRIKEQRKTAPQQRNNSMQKIPGRPIKQNASHQKPSNPKIAQQNKNTKRSKR